MTRPSVFDCPAVIITVAGRFFRAAIDKLTITSSAIKISLLIYASCCAAIIHKKNDTLAMCQKINCEEFDFFAEMLNFAPKTIRDQEL